MIDKEKIISVRKQMKLSQTEFARRIGVDYTTLSRIERGIFQPSSKFIKLFEEFCQKENVYFEEKNELLLKVTEEFNLFDDIKNIIDESYKIANKAVNFALIQRNWLIGQRICTEILKSRKDDYGKNIIKEISKKLIDVYGKGFETRTIYYFIDFYKTFPNILQTVSANSLLSWSHYLVLLQVDDHVARDWYAKEASKEMWSVRTLQRNISTQYYYRLVSTHLKDAVKSEMLENNKSNQINQDDYIKDPMVLEFLGLKEDNTYLEKDLETAILDHINKFLLELGKGFSFVSRQKRIHTEKEDYFIDLVFYNIKLKCYFLVDLKTTKLTHQDVGQMDMYIKMYDELIKENDDNPTIGIILCADTDETIAKYSSLNNNNYLYASKFKLYLPSEEELQREIEKEKMFYLLKNNNK